MTSASTFSWLQFDAEQSRRSRELVRALTEPSSLDSIGIGAIRDGFAELLLPGTSTIHTRIRYVLLVPWAMQHVANRHPRRREQYDRWLRDTEVATIEALRKGNGADVIGIVGRQRGASVRQLPSTIYWSATAAWGIRRAGHLSRGEIRDRALHRREITRTDTGETSPLLVWDPMPTAPKGFPYEALSILPTKEEAQYLLGKLAQTVLPPERTGQDPEPSLLACLARHPDEADQAYAWHIAPEVLRPRTRRLVELAWGFSLVIHGARLRYLDLLFQAKSNRTGVIPPNREVLDDLIEKWIAEMSSESASVQNWAEALPEMFSTLTAHRIRVGQPLRTFVTAWSMAAAQDADATFGDEHLGDLIRTREATLKRSAARLTNPSPMLAWDGELVGSDRLNFRWNVATGHVSDCRAALEAHDAQS